MDKSTRIYLSEYLPAELVEMIDDELIESYKKEHAKKLQIILLELYPRMIQELSERYYAQLIEKHLIE